MESIKYVGKGIGMYNQGIDELPIEIFESNKVKSGIGSNNM